MTLLDRHPDGVLEMLLFNRLGGGKFSENATPLSKIDESSKLLRRVALLDRHPDGVLEMLLFNRLGRRDGVLEMLLFNRLGLRTAATGFAGISSNAALHQQPGCV